jgi:hypothetical protein
MINIGSIETIFLILICVINLVVPAILLVFGYLIYTKINRIEEMLIDK